MMNTEVAIVGGGISGLATAWWLQRAGIHTTVLEQSTRAGGKIESVEKAGYIMDHAATMLVNYRPEVSQFIEESGLNHLKIMRDTLAQEKRYLLHQNQLITVPTTPGHILTSPVWSLRGKLRIAMEPLIKKAGHEDETVADFIRRRFGSELLDTMLEPFVAGIFASDAEKANAYTLLPRLTALEQKFGSIVRGMLNAKINRRRTAMESEVFSFQDGMSTLTQRLAHSLSTAEDSLSTAKGSLQFSAHGNFLARHRVNYIEKAGDRWRIDVQSPVGEKQFSAYHVVLATPAPVSADLISPFDRELAELLAGIEYASMSVVHMGFDRVTINHPLNGTGFLIPAKEQRTINGNLWMSSIFPDRAPDNKVLLTTYLGGTRKPEAIEWSDEQVAERVIDDITGPLNIRAAPEMLTIKRHQQALPLYLGNYYRRCQAIQNLLKNHAGLSLQANYLGGISVRDCLVNGKLTAEKIIGQLGINSLSINSLGINNVRENAEPKGYWLQKGLRDL